MHIDFLLFLFLFTELFVSVRDSDSLLFPVLGSNLISSCVLHDSLENFNLFAHLLVKSLLDSMQVEVKVLSETSDECDDLIDVILEVNFSLVFCDKSNSLLECSDMV